MVCLKASRRDAKSSQGAREEKRDFAVPLQSGCAAPHHVLLHIPTPCPVPAAWAGLDLAFGIQAPWRMIFCRKHLLNALLGAASLLVFSVWRLEQPRELLYLRAAGGRAPAPAPAPCLPALCSEPPHPSPKKPKSMTCEGGAAAGHPY